MERTLKCPIPCPPSSVTSTMSSTANPEPLLIIWTESRRPAADVIVAVAPKPALSLSGLSVTAIPEPRPSKGLSVLKGSTVAILPVS